MGRAGSTTKLLHALNIVYILFGLALAATGIWFFVEVQNITTLRNENHYVLDYNIYWLQVIPWVFIFAGVFVISVSACGFNGARKGKTGVIRTYVVLQAVLFVLLILAAVIALVFADGKAADKFVKDSIWDAFANQKTNPHIETYFGKMERRMQCCGADGPRDYRSWKSDLPISCCDTYTHGWLDSYSIDCGFSNRSANERLGCSTIISQYARIVIKVLSGVVVFLALIALLGILAGISLLRALKHKQPRVVSAHHEIETKKVLL